MNDIHNHKHDEYRLGKKKALLLWLLWLLMMMMNLTEFHVFLCLQKSHALKYR